MAVRSVAVQARDIALDVTAGLCTLLVLLIVIGASHTVRLHLFLPLAAALFFVAAFMRGIWSTANPWVEGCLVTLGGWVPFAVAASIVLHAEMPELGGLGLLLAVVCVGGAQGAKFWKGGDRLAGAATAVVMIAFLLVVEQFAGPWMATSPGFHPMDKPAPRFTLTRLDGSAVTLESLRGHVVVLDFWGTWCAPCMAEMPEISKVHREFQSNNNVVFLAVDPGWNGDTPEKIRSTTVEKHLDVPVALDTTGVAKSLEVTSLPTLLVIGRRGDIRSVDDGGYDANEPLASELSAQIRQLLQSE
jgi:thiol-disulfide isomerase/thioredoxin